jgi:hypothetical protein
MKKVIMGLLLVGACQTTTQQVVGSAATPAVSTSGSGKYGAADPAMAVKGFMVAAKKTDLQAMGDLWGDQTGLARDRFSADELQKRELYVMRCLRHDSYDIIGDAPSLGGARAVVVQVSYGDLTRSANVEVVRGPSQRWYVRDVDTKSLQDICMHRG